MVHVVNSRNQAFELTDAPEDVRPSQTRIRPFLGVRLQAASSFRVKDIINAFLVPVIEVLHDMSMKVVSKFYQDFYFFIEIAFVVELLDSKAIIGIFDGKVIIRILVKETSVP